MKKILILISLMPILFLLSCKTVEGKAVATGDYDSLNQFFSDGGDPDAPQNFGKTLLIIAVESQSPDMIVYLLEAGANINLVGENGRTALIASTIKGYDNIAKQLVESGADIDRQNNNGSTALYYAAKYDRGIIADLFIEKGSDIHIINKYGESPIIAAVKRNAQNDSELTDVLVSLEKAGARFDIRDRHIKDAAFETAESGNLELMKYLFEKGFKANSTDMNNNTLLFPAVSHPDMISYLISQSVPVDSKNFEGNTALHEALLAGEKESMQFLLNNRADPNKRDKNGKTVLIAAASIKRPDIVSLILIAGVNANLFDGTGNNALHYAAMEGDPETVRLLLLAGMDPNEPNAEGLTPLQLSESNSQYGDEIRELLLEAL